MNLTQCLCENLKRSKNGFKTFFSFGFVVKGDLAVNVMRVVCVCVYIPEAVMRLLSPWDRRSSLSLLTSSFSSLTRRAFGSSLMTALHFICLARSAYLQQDTRWLYNASRTKYCRKELWFSRVFLPESTECFFIINICWAQSSNHGRARVSTFKHKHSIKLKHNQKLNESLTGLFTKI